MTPQEKAKDLVERYKKELLKGKYFISGFVIEELAEKCALIAVDELMNQLTVLPYGMQYLLHIDYLEEVKQEIQEL